MGTALNTSYAGSPQCPLQAPTSIIASHAGLPTQARPRHAPRHAHAGPPRRWFILPAIQPLPWRTCLWVHRGYPGSSLLHLALELAAGTEKVGSSPVLTLGRKRHRLARRPSCWLLPSAFSLAADALLAQSTLISLSWAALLPDGYCLVSGLVTQAYNPSYSETRITASSKLLRATEQVQSQPE